MRPAQRSVVAALLVVSCCLCSETNNAASAQTSTPVKVRWQDTADSDKVEFLIQDHLARGVGRDGLHVLGILEDNGHEAQVLVVVKNDAKQAVNVIPSAMALEVTKPEEKTLAYIPPEKLALAKRRTPLLAILGAGLQGFAAGMQTQQSTTTGTVTTSDGSTATYEAQTTTRDPAAQEMAQARIEQNARERRQEREAAAAQIQNTALLGNTVFPGNYIMGWVYFERTKVFDKCRTPNCVEVVFRLPLGGYIFEIPFAGSTAKR